MNALQHRSLIVSVAVHVGFVAFARFAKPGALLRDPATFTQMEFSLWTPAPWRQLAQEFAPEHEPEVAAIERPVPTPLAPSHSKPPSQPLLREISQVPLGPSTTALATPEPTGSMTTTGSLSREAVFGPGRDSADPYAVGAASRGQALLTNTPNAVRGLMREIPSENPVTPTDESETRGLQGVGGMSNNLRRMSEQWSDERDRSSPAPRPAGATRYLRQVAGEAGQHWHPVRATDPGIAESITRVLTGGQQAYETATRDSLGVFASDRGAAAASDLDAAHPNSPTLRPSITLGQAGRATASRYAVEVEVQYSPAGEMLGVRVAQTSGTRFFDQQAVAAIREAIASMGVMPRVTNAQGAPTGWRVRWEFELRIARNPPFTLNAGAAGEPSVLGNGSMAAGPSINLLSAGVEWGGVDPARIQLPFGLQRYQRIRVLWVRAVRAAPNVSPANSR